MAETLHRPESTQKSFDESTNDALALGNSGHEPADNEDRTLQAARSIVDIPAANDSSADRYQIPTTEARTVPVPERTTTQSTYNRRRGIAVGVAGIAVVTGAATIPAAVDAVSNAHVNGGASFSEESATHIAHPGDTIWGIADKVEGTDTVDKQDVVSHIQNDPANISVLEDGLQAGDTITIPVSVE